MKKILIVEDKQSFQLRVAYSILVALEGLEDSEKAVFKKMSSEVDPVVDFKKLGYELMITGHASKATELLADNDFEMISLDGRIFRGHGNDLLQLIPKENHAEKVLLFSGSLDDFEENSANKVSKGGWNTIESLVSVSKQILNL